MKTAFSKFFFLFLLFPLATFASVPGKKGSNDGFDVFYRQFQAAVAKGDGEAISGMCAFPKFRWEAIGSDDLKTKAEFLKQFPQMFTPAVKKKIATGKPYKTSYGDYFIDWREGNLQKSLVFDHQPNGGFKFSGLLVGPS
ncbi:MAG: hypothetical protein U1F57_11215 [bacterium]